EQRAEARLLHRLLRTVQPVAAEPGEVDPLLEVDVHPARCRGEGTIRHAGLLGSCTSARAPRLVHLGSCTSARAPQSKDLCSVAVKQPGHGVQCRFTSWQTSIRAPGSGRGCGWSEARA